MRFPVVRTMLLAGLATSLMAIPAVAKTVDAEDETVAAKPVAAEPARAMKGRLGFGVDQILGASLTSLINSSTSIIAIPNALAVRYYVTNKMALDLAYANGSTTVITDLMGKDTTASGNAWGVGLGAKYTLTQPSRYLLMQAVVKGSFAKANLSLSNEGTEYMTGRVETSSVFVGPAFEVFVPSWEWLSLEGQVGFCFRHYWTDLNTGSAKDLTMDRLNMGGSGFSPINVAIHAYF